MYLKFFDKIFYLTLIFILFFLARIILYFVFEKDKLDQQRDQYMK